jgi:hypothetical protein
LALQQHLESQLQQVLTSQQAPLQRRGLLRCAHSPLAPQQHQQQAAVKQQQTKAARPRLVGLVQEAAVLSQQMQAGTRRQALPLLHPHSALASPQVRGLQQGAAQLLGLVQQAAAQQAGLTAAAVQQK